MNHPLNLNLLSVKDPKNNNTLLTKVFFKPTDIHQMLHKHSFHPKHTFKGLLRSQIIRFFRLCSNEKDCILFQALCKRNYSKRWMRGIKGKTVRELQIKQRRSNIGIPTTSRWGSKPCNIMNCMTCHLISDCSNVTSTVTQKTFQCLFSFFNWISIINKTTYMKTSCII